MRVRRRKDKGFTLLEVSIAIVLIVLVSTTAMASLRMGVRTMDGTRLASVSSAVIREFRENTYSETIEEIDARDDQTFDPVLGNGEPMTEADGITVKVLVQPVDDLDPTQPVAASESRTRVLTVSTWYEGRSTMEAVWLVAEH